MSIAQNKKLETLRRMSIHQWIASRIVDDDDKHAAYLEYTTHAPQAAAMYADVLQERAAWQPIERGAYYG